MCLHASVMLPVVQSLPAVLAEVPTTITTAVIHAILPAAAPPIIVALGEPPRHLVSGVLLRGGEASKRRRRPPGWLAQYEQGDDEISSPEDGPMGTHAQVVYDEARYVYHDEHHKRYFGRVVGDGIQWLA